jgi:arylsulfatase A-like enzyme
MRKPISRRDMLRGAATGVVTLALGMETKGASASGRPPNFLFILADDLGYADVACYGRPDLKTPNIDRLAAHGVRFLQAYASSAVCTGNRVALITGSYQ